MEGPQLQHDSQQAPTTYTPTPTTHPCANCTRRHARLLLGQGHRHDAQAGRHPHSYITLRRGELAQRRGVYHAACMNKHDASEDRQAHHPWAPTYLPAAALRPLGKARLPGTYTRRRPPGFIVSSASSSPGTTWPAPTLRQEHGGRSRGGVRLVCIRPPGRAVLALAVIGHCKRTKPCENCARHGGNNPSLPPFLWSTAEAAAGVRRPFSSCSYATLTFTHRLGEAQTMRRPPT